MQYFRHSRIVRFAILPLTLLAFLPACYRWTEVGTTVEASPEPLPSPTRVTLMDGRQLELEDATITQDSLFGTLKGSQESVRVASDDLRKVESKTGSAAVSAIGLVAMVGIIAIIVSSVEIRLFGPDVNVGGS